jgi:hypothetical protein
LHAREFSRRTATSIYAHPDNEDADATSHTFFSDELSQFLHVVSLELATKRNRITRLLVLPLAVTAECIEVDYTGLHRTTPNYREPLEPPRGLV